MKSNLYQQQTKLEIDITSSLCSFSFLPFEKHKSSFFTSTFYCLFYFDPPHNNTSTELLVQYFMALFSFLQKRKSFILSFSALTFFALWEKVFIVKVPLEIPNRKIKKRKKRKSTARRGKSEEFSIQTVLKYIRSRRNISDEWRWYKCKYFSRPPTSPYPQEKKRVKRGKVWKIKSFLFSFFCCFFFM